MLIWTRLTSFSMESISHHQKKFVPPLEMSDHLITETNLNITIPKKTSRGSCLLLKVIRKRLLLYTKNSVSWKLFSLLLTVASHTKTSTNIVVSVGGARKDCMDLEDLFDVTLQ